ncbi:MAG: NAD(P)H-dependent oxidoreductase [Flavobacteriales bacterium]|nr:NAD(P)H-dependent oxidoreductase [Flavobacteriales bacterium]
MKVAILSGTSRKNNNTLRVAKAIKNLHELQNDEVEIVDFQQYDLPFSGGEIDETNPTNFQKHLLNTWQKAHLVYVLSPEYNWMMTPELSNLVNHYSGNHHAPLYSNKVFAMVGVSSGIGGRIPTMQLCSVFEKIIFHLGQFSVISPNKFESHYTQKELDENGNYIAETGYQNRLEKFVGYASSLTQRFVSIEEVQ